MRFFGRKKRIYLDYASATPVLPEALRAVERAAEAFGNPGAIHEEGVEAKRLLLAAREGVALELGCKARELIFVSGGTEANNLAILGFARQLEIRGTDLKDTHWVVSAIEHPSVLECFGEVERRGGTVSFIEPNEHGLIIPEALSRALRKNTVFVSVQWANHEIGTVQQLRELSRVIQAHEKESKSEVIFHSDFGQAPLYLAPHVHTLGVDIASLDSGKLYGPRGIGCIYLHNRVALAPVVLGGGQERGLRAGTENVALAAGFAEAFSSLGKMREKESRRVKELRDALAKNIVEKIPDAVVNGSLAHILPHSLNISIPGISSEYATLALDRAGIAVSTKSACREGEERRSHVVEALKVDEWRAANTLRFSLGLDTVQRDISGVIEALPDAVAKSRM